MIQREQGFTMVELLVSTSLTMCITAAIFAAVHPTESIFSVESEAADMQQRLRVTNAVLFNDLVMAGAGTATGAFDVVPPITPYRQSDTGGDSAGTFRNDVITLMYVPAPPAETTIASQMPARSAAVRVNVGVRCPMTDAACGLSRARTAVIYDTNGSFDRFRIDSVDGSLVELHHTIADSSMVYPPGSRIVEAIVRSYFLKADAATDTYQLMRDDGDGNPAVPVVDHVVQLGFEYFGDRPDTLEPTDPSGLIELTAANLTDGPWRPDAGAPNRFDADLLRIRKIAVTIRVESAIHTLRGPAGILFSRGGTSTSGNRLLPDRTSRFQVSRRNMSMVR